MAQSRRGRDIYDYPDSPKSQREGNSQLPFETRRKKGMSSTRPLPIVKEDVEEEQAVLVENETSEKGRTKKRKGEVLDNPARSKDGIFTPRPASLVEHVEVIVRQESYSKPSMMQSVVNTRQTRSKHIGPHTELGRPTRSKTKRTNQAEPTSPPKSRTPDQPNTNHDRRPTREGSKILGEPSAHDDSDNLPTVREVITPNMGKDQDQPQRQSSTSEFNDSREQSSEESVNEEDDGMSEASERDTQQRQSQISEPSRQRQPTDLPEVKHDALRPYAQRIKDVLGALKNVGRQTRKDSTIQHPLQLKTSIVKDLVRLIVQTKNTYLELVSVDPQDLEECIDTLNDRLEDIKGKIDGISEDKSKKNDEGSSTVVDVYAHAIPKLVRMLRAAFRCESVIECQGTAGLERIVKILELVQLLGQKARNWKPRPDSSLHVVKPINDDVIPPLRDMKKDLQKLIDKRKRDAKLEASNAQNELVRQKKEEAYRRQREESEQLIKERHLLIEQQLAQREGRQASTRSPPLQIEPGVGEAFERVCVFQSSGRSRKGVEEWAWSEITALIKGLERFTGMRTSPKNHPDSTPITHHSYLIQVQTVIIASLMATVDLVKRFGIGTSTNLFEWRKSSKRII